MARVEAFRTRQEIWEEVAFLRRSAGEQVDGKTLAETEVDGKTLAETEMLAKFGENGLYSFACHKCGGEPTRLRLVQEPNGEGSILKIGNRELIGTITRLCDSC